MSRLVLTASVLLASAAIAGCSSWAEPSAPPIFKVTGAVVVSEDLHKLLTDNSGPEGVTAGGTCQTLGAHDDITAGAQVVIRDGDGKLAGIGELGAGVGGAEGLTCSFPLTVTEVSDGQPFYTMEVAHRGLTYYTAAKIREPLLLNVR